MNQLSRREFFKRLKFNATGTIISAVSVVAPPRRAVVTPIRYEEHQMACARCCAPFTAMSDEALCPECREADAQQRALLASWFK
jgi:Zn finger protein HypA/HybF involved in hydrogenase expression